MTSRGQSGAFLDWDASLSLSAQDRADARLAIDSGARLTASYLLMNTAATLIAGFGLLANSEAVIIGAMLIAMLYGPILAIGLAFAELNRDLLLRALAAEAVGAVWVFLVALALGWLNRDVPIGDEILARTAPNFLDLMIAFVGGAAGAYATASPRVSSAVVGVAIATALCPPLASCGILVAHGYPQLATGSLLLFITNFTAIAVAAMLTFLVMGYRTDGGLAGSWTARAVPIVMLVPLSIYLLDTFRRTIEDASLRGRIEAVLRDGLKDQPGARAADVRLTSEGDRPTAYAVIRTPRQLSRDLVVELDDAVDRAAGKDVSLHLRVVLIDEITRDGLVYPSREGSERARIGR